MSSLHPISSSSLPANHSQQVIGLLYLDPSGRGRSSFRRIGSLGRSWRVKNRMYGFWVFSQVTRIDST